DGGTVREVLRHASVKRVVLAEIDAGVIEVCREFFPALAGDLENPRVKIQVGDGAQFLAEHPGEFDVVLSDSTDPVGPGEVLFKDDYFRTAKQALRPGGAFVTQCEGFWLNRETVTAVADRLRRHFRIVLPYMTSIPTYPTGTWLFLFASDTLDPRRTVDQTRQQQIIATARYYTADLQTAAFAVPAFLSAGAPR
ncbi:MAG: fused MFS/spermidine synthase, partial [bacterium]|nr:fused MFS/spermidine synthase [bacterium]